MVQLYDHLNRPIDMAKLRGEQAGPTLTGVRNILSGHPAQGLTPARLARLLREAEDGDTARYLELAEEMEEKDLHYLAVLGTRKRAVSQLDITVEPASDSVEDETNAELIRDFLGREELEDELVDILDAIGKGFSATEIIWETSERQWMPQRLEFRDPRWFVFDRADGRTLKLRELGGPVDLTPFKYIIHRHKAKSGLPIRGGFARAVAWGYLFKNYTVKDWMTFIEIYGQPLRVGKYHAGATEADKETLLKAVANIGTDAAAIIPQSMVIEFIKAEQRGSSDLYKHFAEYIDKQVSKAVVGQTLTTEVSEGSRAAAQVHDEVRADIERADCRQLEAILLRDLVRPVVDLNRGPQKAYPSIHIGRPEQVDVEGLTKALERVVPLGLRVRQSEVRRKLDLEEPEDDDELLSPPSPEPTPQEDGPEDQPQDTAQATARQQDSPATPPDSIDNLADQILEDEGWREVMEPVVGPLQGLINDTESLEEIRDRLAEALEEMDTAALADRLAEGMFAARLAGDGGAQIRDDSGEDQA